MTAKENVHERMTQVRSDEDGGGRCHIRMFYFAEPVAWNRFRRAVAAAGIPREGDMHPDYPDAELYEVIRVGHDLAQVVGARLIYRTYEVE